MILFVGQVARDMREREAFQELDYRAVFGTMAKWATEIDDPARIPEIVSRAFYTATSGRPGPVVIALPEDMLVERVAVAGRAGVRAGRDLARPRPTWRDCRSCCGRRSGRSCSLGGSRWSEAACAALARFAERFALPVATTFRRAHLFDPLHPSYAGDLGIGPNPKLLARIKAADLVVLVGGRLGEMPVAGLHAVRHSRRRSRRFVHVHPGAEELGRVYRPHLAIHAAPTAFAAALEGLQPPNEIPWRDADQGRACRLSRLDRASRPRCPAPSISARSWCGCATNLPADAIICNGAGNFSAWMHRFYRFRRLRHPDRADLRLDGLRRAGGGRR